MCVQTVVPRDNLIKQGDVDDKMYEVSTINLNSFEAPTLCYLQRRFIPHSPRERPTLPDINIIWEQGEDRDILEHKHRIQNGKDSKKKVLYSLSQPDTKLLVRFYIPS